MTISTGTFVAYFETPWGLLESTFDYPEGTILKAGQFFYKVAASGASDQHLKRKDGKKLYLMHHREMPLSSRQFGSFGDGASHPLSEKFASLGAAQGVYPTATDLTDEIDWCAWQMLADFLYTRDNGEGVTNNFAAGDVVCDGHFLVNSTVTFNLATLKMKGQALTQRGLSALTSAFEYNGDDGTLDAPVWLLDCWLFDENGDPPPGRNGNTAYSGGTKVEIEDALFLGKKGSLTGQNGDESGYISGLRLRKAAFSRIVRCAFDGTLWDAINTTDAQLFLTIANNHFYGIYRDAIAIHRGGSTFSTTCWIDNNEIAIVGRYRIFADFRGSIDADIRIRDNSIEGTVTSFFLTRPDWWVNGIVSPVCIIEGGNAILDGNRFEALTDANDYMLADICLIGGTHQKITGGVARKLVCSSLKSSAPENAALLAFHTSAGYRDITDTRNYNCGVTGDTRNGVAKMTVDGVYILAAIFFTDGIYSSSGQTVLRNIDVSLLSLPVVEGTYASQIEATQSAIPTLIYPLYMNFQNARVLSKDGLIRFEAGTRAQGPALAIGDVQAAAAWAAETDVASHAGGLALNNLRRPTTYNGYLYQAIAAGTTGATEPTWPTAIGGTVEDGTVVWECVATTFATADVGSSGTSFTLEGQKANWRRSSAPTAGRHYRGEIAWNTAPSAGGTLGWVCTAAGVPGTWKAIGGIAA